MTIHVVLTDRAAKLCGGRSGAVVQYYNTIS